MRIKTERYLLVGLLVAICGFYAYGCGDGSSSGQTSTGPSPAKKISTTQSASTEDSLPAGVVASVDGSDITEATLNHWVAVQSVTNYESIPKRPVPSGVIPDPPLFRACIAYQRTGGATGKVPEKARTNAELLASCASSYQALRGRMLGQLIAGKWFEAEVKAAGVRVSEQEVKTLFARFRKEQYGAPAKYQRYLELTGQSLADQYMHMRLDLYSLALLKHFQSQGTPQLEHYIHNFAVEWAAKTSCQPADVVPNCREYRGSVEPEAAI
jgi:hypothetical protein